MATTTIYVLNGPNMNLLGTREPEKYGRATLADVEKLCAETAKRFGLGIVFRQSNREGELVDWIQEAHAKDAAAIIINAAGYTTTSIAIMDALLAVNVKLPVIEVHLSNIFRREAFRHTSYISAAAKGVICGFGSQSYILALDAIAYVLENEAAARD